jgi:hypothetical protein
MKNRIAKAIVLLNLTMALSGGMTHLSAGVCSVPSCRPRPLAAAPAADSRLSYQDYLYAVWAISSIWF